MAESAVPMRQAYSRGSFVDVAFAIAMTLSGITIAAQTSRHIDTSAWKTFRSDAMGFQVRYPPTWRPRAVSGAVEGVLLLDTSRSGDQAPLSVQFFVQRRINPRGLSIEDWYIDQAKRMSGPPPAMTTAVVGRRQAIRQEALLATGRHYDFYVALNDADVFQVSLNEASAQGQLDPMSEAIISTVQFVR